MKALQPQALAKWEWKREWKWGGRGIRCRRWNYAKWGECSTWGALGSHLQGTFF